VRDDILGARHVSGTYGSRFVTFLRGTAPETCLNEELAMNVRVYALSTCPHCRAARKYLDENGVAYELREVDTLEGSARDVSTPKGKAVSEVKELSGGTSFPVVVIGDDVVIGFDKSRIAQLLGL
jgi:glutaredoxin